MTPDQIEILAAVIFTAVVAALAWRFIGRKWWRDRNTPDFHQVASQALGVITYKSLTFDKKFAETHAKSLEQIYFRCYPEALKTFGIGPGPGYAPGSAGIIVAERIVDNGEEIDAHFNRSDGGYRFLIRANSQNPLDGIGWAKILATVAAAQVGYPEGWEREVDELGKLYRYANLRVVN